MSMINLPIQSSNNEIMENILKNFLDGKVSLTDLQAVVDGYIAIDFSQAPELRNIQELYLDESIKIPVKNNHLCSMLRKYISGETSELNLSNWAAFIVMTPFFVPEGKTEKERWQAGEEPLWEILQKLVTPGVYGELNPDIAHSYMSILSCNS